MTACKLLAAPSPLQHYGPSVNVAAAQVHLQKDGHLEARRKLCAPEPTLTALKTPEIAGCADKSLFGELNLS